MQYYLISPRVDGQTTDGFLEQMFSQHIVMMGWGPDNKIGSDFRKLKCGDFVLVAQRVNWKFNYYFAGVISDDCSYVDGDGIQCRKLKHFIDLRETSTDFLADASFAGMQAIKAMLTINPDDNKSVINKLHHIIQVKKEQEKMQYFISLLKANFNLILTGAPGTGKTHRAKNIAAQMICGKPYTTELENDEIFKSHCKFVQFHPSFDYTDFVEGLRPMPQNERSSDIKFVRQNGIFKDFCKDAILRRDKDLDMAFNQFVADIKARKITTIPLKTKESAKLIVKEEGNIRWYSEKEVNNISSNAVSKERLLKLYTRYSTLEELDSISNQDLINVIGGCDPTYFWGTLHYLLENYMNYPYIFIIDEINRGEISKIFGELFFCIESGYRGIKGRVQTQYQNLVEPTDTFADGFYIPENVFIIGTMNDIDRSVESLDFAMRRRFAFEEIQASDTIEMIKSNDNLREFYQDIEKRMKNLNLCILTIQGFSSAYQIGAAYFLKLANYLEGNKLTEKSWENLWNNHLQPLLFEYLRGLRNASEELKKLSRAYLLEETYKLNDERKVVKDE